MCEGESKAKAMYVYDYALMLAKKRICTVWRVGERARTMRGRWKWNKREDLDGAELMRNKALHTSLCAHHDVFG